MNDRIRLAEAMGLPVSGVKKHGIHVGWFDPFTDANDDYAVRDFMSNKPGRDHWIHFKNALAEIGAAFSCNYQIGDYARAALKVLDNE